MNRGRSGALGGSIRDPAGFVFRRDGVVYRQVNRPYERHYRRLRSSGLRSRLLDAGLLLPFEEVPSALAPDDRAVRVLRPRQIGFVSYPYEWCFSQLRDAALATLEIQEQALVHGMTLKDATPFNIQHVDGRPVLIDHLSFEERDEGSPWIAYRQFCETFYAPLALASFRDVRTLSLTRAHPDGVPLDYAVALLPYRAFLRLSHFLHLALHGWLQARGEHGEVSADLVERRGVGAGGITRVVESLRRGVESLRRPSVHSPWADYQPTDSYSAEAAEAKERLVEEVLSRLEPRTVWDLGANTGRFSEMAAAAGARVVAMDADAEAVEAMYRRFPAAGEPAVLPLSMDLRNPSPALGWAHRETLSLRERGPADLVLALALIHHLVIRGNIPLDQVLGYLASCGDWLLVEFVPRDDPQVRRLLGRRASTGHPYARGLFEDALRAVGHVDDVTQIPGSERTLHLVRTA